MVMIPDPDSGGTKTYGSKSECEFATILKRLLLINLFFIRIRIRIQNFYFGS
jgi:hypothetical protein